MCLHFSLESHIAIKQKSCWFKNQFIFTLDLSAHSRVTFRNKLFTPKFLSHWFLTGHLQLPEFHQSPQTWFTLHLLNWLCSLESERHKLAEFVFWAFTAFEWCSYHHSLHFDQASRALASHHHLPNIPSSPPQLAVEWKHSVHCYASGDSHLLAALGLIGSMWGTALLQNWTVELCGTCPVSKGDEDVKAPAGLGHLY